MFLSFSFIPKPSPLSGGLRFGEMERDCIISHGAAAFLKERLFDQSDAYRVHACESCGVFAVANLKKGTFFCPACKRTTKCLTR